VQIAKGFEITFQTARSEAMSEKIGQIRFFPDGSATGGRIGLALDGQRVEVAVDWLTGLVSVNHAASS
jgi:general secretion pathway protein H